MNTGTLHKGSRRMRVVKGLLLQAATAALVAACGGGGYGDDGGRRATAPPPPPPAAVIRDAQFVDDTVDGPAIQRRQRRRRPSPSAAGNFQFAEGRKIDFFVGGATNRIAIGSATPVATPAGSSPSACTTSTKCRPPTATSIWQPAAPAGAARCQRRHHRRLPDRRRREQRRSPPPSPARDAGLRGQRGRLRRTTPSSPRSPPR